MFLQPEREHVRPEALCPELLRAATGRLRGVLGMEHVERLLSSAHFREAAVGLDMGVLVDAEQLPQLHLMLTEVRLCVFSTACTLLLASAAAAHADPRITPHTHSLSRISPTHSRTHTHSHVIVALSRPSNTQRNRSTLRCLVSQGVLRRWWHGRHTDSIRTQACALLGVAEAPRLYVKFSLTPAAYALRVHAFCHTVVLTSALLELLDPPELQAVLTLTLTRKLTPTWKAPASAGTQP